MAEFESILDRVIDAKRSHDLSEFDPLAVVGMLLASLPGREADIVKHRFNLFVDATSRETLEQIGNRYGVTRERVRQLQRDAIASLKRLSDTAARQALNALFQIVHQTLIAHGGAMTPAHLAAMLLRDSASSAAQERALNFLLNEIADQSITVVEPDWAKRLIVYDRQGLKQLQQLVAIVEGVVEAHASVIAEPALAALVSDAAAKAGFVDLGPAQIAAAVRASAKLDRNVFGQWGLGSWGLTKPRRMNDKVYLILLEAGQPLHFKEVADRINRAKFDRKIAYPATVHNELILDDKFVLIGRGIYALAEWGYTPGTVSDVITAVLREHHGVPMSREDIVAEVLKRRRVRRATIHLALVNHEHFLKDARGMYTLA